MIKWAMRGIQLYANEYKNMKISRNMKPFEPLWFFGKSLIVLFCNKFLSLIQ